MAIRRRFDAAFADESEDQDTFRLWFSFLRSIAATLSYLLTS
jgi:hypothetical protein